MKPSPRQVSKDIYEGKRIQYAGQALIKKYGMKVDGVSAKEIDKMVNTGKAKDVPIEKLVASL